MERASKQSLAVSEQVYQVCRDKYLEVWPRFSAVGVAEHT